MPRSARGITLRAVAAELGVSPMTVSNAYNRPDQLSSALRERVLATARRLGYAGPDPLARGLRRGQAGALGLVYDTPLTYAVRDPAAAALLEGLCDACERAGVGLLLVPGSMPEARDTAAVGAALVDGLVVYSVAEGDDVLAAALEREVPAVVVDQPQSPAVPFVRIDDHAAARAAANHVLDLGHRRLAVLSFGLSPDGHEGPVDEERRRRARYPVTRLRLAGYAAAFGARGLSWSDVPLHECPVGDRTLGRAATHALLDARPRPTAVLATSDELALGAVDAARERGLAVPDQLSVVGFDDVPAAAAASPPLTTVHQDHARKGRLAGEILLARLHGDPGPRARRLPHRLVVRHSTATPAVGR